MTNFFSDYLAAWHSMDVDRVMAFFTDDVDFGDTTLGHGAVGTDRMRRFVAASFAAVPEARFEYVRHFLAGDDYAIVWVMRPHPSDDGIEGVSIGRLRDGRICHHRDYWNGAAVPRPPV